MFFGFKATTTKSVKLRETFVMESIYAAVHLIKIISKPNVLLKLRRSHKRQYFHEQSPSVDSLVVSYSRNYH